MDSHSSLSAASGPLTDFGFRQVPEKEKRALVREVFDSVSGNYDLMNDAMSLGIHRIWKRIFLAMLNPRPHQKLLDLGGGTGDISFGWRRRGGGPVLLSDINPSMLSRGRDRAIDQGMLEGLDYCCIDAEEIPLRTGSMDRVTMAFSLRNCTNKTAVLSEVFRVLKPGGRFLCLEFSPRQIPALKPLYDLWSFQVLPRLGEMLAKDRESYQYLAESIRMFPAPEKLEEMMASAGFEHVAHRILSGGIVAIHSGWKL